MKTIQAAALLLAITGLAVSQPAFAKSVARAHRHQEKRIREGVKSGELTKTEAKDLHQDEKGIHEEAQADRQANGGKLSKADRKKIRGEQRQESKKIYTDKHNAETRPESPAADKK